MIILNHTSAILLAIAMPQATPVQESAPGSPDALTALKAAASDVVAANSYRFEVEARLADKEGNEAAEDGRVIAFEGAYQRSMPLHIAGSGEIAANLEAYRLADKVVFRSDEGAWQLHADPGTTGELSNEAVWATCVLPAPHDLLRNLDSKLMQVTRVTEDEGLFSADKLVYRAKLEPEAIAACLKEKLEPGNVDCTIRITTTGEGAIEEITIHARCNQEEELIANGAPDMVIHYTLIDVGDDVELDVPEQVNELLLAG
jgi:hypothetical protein